MSIAVDRIRAEAMANIQTALMIMDGKMANLSRDEPGPKIPQSPAIRARAERMDRALDEIRAQVRHAYGEKAKVSSRLVKLWLDIRTRAIRSRKTGLQQRETNLQVH